MTRIKVILVTCVALALGSAVAASLLGISVPIGNSGLSHRLLKFSGGSVTFYATSPTDTVMPSC